MRNLLLLFCLTLAVAACNSSKNMVKLADVKWNLETLDGKKLELKDSASEVFIQFDEVEKRASGRAGCNRFFGNYEMNGDKLKFSPMGATRMACPDMEIESAFFKMLENVDSFSIKDKHLSFLQNGNVVAGFKMAEEPKNEK